MNRDRDLTMAYHEAGHAVIARALGVGVVHIALFSLDPGSRGGAQSRSASWLAPADDLLAQIAGYEIDAKVSLAGPQAQLSYRPGRMRWEHEWSSDLAYARSFIARSVLLKHGVKLSSDPEPFTLSSAQFAEADELLKLTFAEVKALVEAHWLAIERVAEALVERRLLSDLELDDLIANRPVLPWH